MAQIELDYNTVQEDPKIVVLQIIGDVDESNAQKVEDFFDQLMKKEQPQHMLVDLTALVFAGSCFFSSLLFWKEEVAKGGGRLVLFGLRPEIASTMRIFALDRVLTICDNRDRAMEQVAAS